MDHNHYSFRGMKAWQIDILVECCCWDWQQVRRYAETL